MQLIGISAYVEFDFGSYFLVSQQRRPTEFEIIQPNVIQNIVQHNMGEVEGNIALRWPTLILKGIENWAQCRATVDLSCSK